MSENKSTRGCHDHEALYPCNVAEKKCGTYPCCPPVRAMPSDDAQFVIERDEELPAEIKTQMGDEIMKANRREKTAAKDCEGSHENAIYEVVELHYRHYR